MKILFLCEYYHPHQGGAEVLFRNLAEGLVKAGHKVTVLTQRLPHTPKQEIMDGVTIKRIPSPSRYAFSFLAIPSAIQLARKHDIIQTTTFNGSPPSWFAGKITGKPVVLTVHEVWKGRWKEIMGFSRLSSFVHELLERSIYVLPYSKYVCVSRATKKDLLRLGISEQKVEQVHNGFDYALWKDQKIKNRDTLREEFGVEKNFVYVSWGRPGPSKGFEYLLKAMPLIAEQIPHAKLLLLLGAPSNFLYRKKYRQLMALISALHIENSVRVITPFSREELGNCLRAADCVIVPSIAEGFGYTTLEAVAMDKPVIISSAGSLPEVVAGKYLIFENKNSPDLAEKAVKMARGEYCTAPRKDFSWERCVERYEKVYKALAEKKLRKNLRTHGRRSSAGTIRISEGGAELLLHS